MQACVLRDARVGGLAGAGWEGEGEERRNRFEKRSDFILPCCPLPAFSLPPTPPPCFAILIGLPCFFLPRILLSPAPFPKVCL